MTKQAFLILASIVALAVKPAMGADGLECLISVYQQDANNKDVRLFLDSVTLVKEIPASGFLMGVSVDIKLTAVDSLRASFDIHVVTLGLPGKNAARRFDVEYGLPARISEIEVKPGAFYTVEVKPLSYNKGSRTIQIHYRSHRPFVLYRSGDIWNPRILVMRPKDTSLIAPHC